MTAQIDHCLAGNFQSPCLKDNFGRVLCKCVGLLAFLLVVSNAVRADDLLFETDVQPILRQKCGSCHGQQVRKAGLNAVTMSGLRHGGESGEPGVAESPDESMLWIMIESDSMPPEGKPQLTSAEKEIIHRWLQEGAPSRTAEDDQPRITQHDVLPIVLLRCVTCHGAELQRGGVDLRTVSSMKRGGTKGPALVPGNASASLMIQRIESEACPPREQLLKYFVKRPPSGEVEKLKQWIDEGATEFDIQPDVATTDPDPLVTDEDRQHWSFQPPSLRRSYSTIDEFIEERLQAAGLSFTDEANPDQLIRRAYIDLTGLPPGVDDWQRWRKLAADSSADWYATMIDELLDSPRYGERWARYWLDVAGYADSEGGVSADPLREVAWKYRDYVVRSFNEDKPYDQFLTEQIAGDELIDYERAAEVTDGMVDNLVATGFLRMGIDQTGSRTMNYVPERLGVVDDAIRVLGSGVMGLTVECARCHSHKYDPLPQRDYYRLKAVLQGAYDEHDWLTFRNRRLEVATPAHRQRVAATNPPLQKELKRLQSEQKRLTTELRLALLRHHYPNQPEDDRTSTINALKIADNNRSQPQRILVEMLQQVEVIPDDQQPDSVLQIRQQLEDCEREMIRVSRQLEPPLQIRALWDRGRPSPTYLLRRGDHDKPGPLVGPGVPSVLTDGRTPFEVTPPFPDGTEKSGRRLAFAKWLTSDSHPLTARVYVNRIWYRHFGRGLVATLDNFGIQGDEPTHPELLDWLAIEFVRSGWSVKHLHRLMMNSRTYRQSGMPPDHQAAAVDPTNELLSRFPIRRMDAETLRDSLLFVAGRLDLTAGGPPEPISVSRDGLVTIRPLENGNWRRSLYAQHRRTTMPSMLTTFDYPVMGPNCIDRPVSTVSPQALMLLNNETVRTLANDLAGRILDRWPNDSKRTAQENADECVRRLYAIALSRPPSEQERLLGRQALSQLQQAWDGNFEAALQTYCHTILNSAAFIYVD